MKHLILLLLVFFALTQTQAQIRIVEVNPLTDEIHIKNFGGASVDISSYRWCARFIYTALSSTNVVSGSLNLSAGATVVLDGWAINNTSSDLGLYLPTGSFAVATNMVDFMQYGAGGIGRESVAVTKGIWGAGDFVSGSAPFDYTGNGAQNGVTFWQASGAPVSDFNADKTSICGSDSVTFTEATSGIISSWSWNFGTGASPATANTQGPHKVSYSTDGFKTVSLTVSGPGGNDSTAKFNYISVDSNLFVIISGPNDFCTGDSIPMDAGAGFDTYAWNTGDSTRIIAVDSGGTYWVTVTLGACAGSDSDVVVEDTNLVSVMITPQDPVICTGDTVILDAGVHTTYAWSSCAATQTIPATFGGDWWVQVSEGGTCTAGDTVTITENFLPTVDIGPDTALANGAQITLDATGTNLVSWIWSTGDTSSSIVYTSTGVADSVGVFATKNTGCVGEDHIIIGIPGGVQLLAPSSLLIQPNPTTSSVSILADPGALYVFDLMGQLKISTKHNKVSHLDVSWMSQGVYLIKLVNSVGSITKKLVVE